MVGYIKRRVRWVYSIAVHIRGWQCSATRKACARKMQRGKHSLPQFTDVRLPSSRCNHQADNNIVRIGILVLRPWFEVESPGGEGQQDSRQGRLQRRL